jgi:hypothetical protein
MVLMERATRFMWNMQCGRKDRKLFKSNYPGTQRFAKQGPFSL